MWGNGVKATTAGKSGISAPSHEMLFHCHQTITSLFLRSASRLQVHYLPALLSYAVDYETALHGRELICVIYLVRGP